MEIMGKGHLGKRSRGWEKGDVQVGHIAQGAKRLKNLLPPTLTLQNFAALSGHSSSSSPPRGSIIHTH